MLRTVAIASLIVGLFAGAAGTAQAQSPDRKNYAGATCVPYFGAYPYLDAAAIYNPSTTQSSYVACIAPKDGTDIAGAWIKVIDRNPASNVVCSLVRAYQIGASTTTLAETRSSFGPPPAGFQTLTFSPAASGDSSAYYYINCIIPPSTSLGDSGVGSFQISEWGSPSF